jgi:hypothetical protein
MLKRACESDCGNGEELSQRIPAGFVRSAVVSHVSNTGRPFDRLRAGCGAPRGCA